MCMCRHCVNQQPAHSVINMTYYLAIAVRMYFDMPLVETWLTLSFHNTVNGGTQCAKRQMEAPNGSVPVTT
jgi:hypothetical protein